MFGMLVLGHGPMETGSAQDDRISPSLRLRWRVKCGKVGRQELNQDRNQMNKLRFSLAGALSVRSEEHTSELQSRGHLVCRLLLEKNKIINQKDQIKRKLDVH